MNVDKQKLSAWKVKRSNLIKLKCSLTMYNFVRELPRQKAKSMNFQIKSAFSNNYNRLLAFSVLFIAEEEDKRLCFWEVSKQALDFNGSGPFGTTIKLLLQSPFSLSARQKRPIPFTICRCCAASKFFPILFGKCFWNEFYLNLN